VKFTSFKSFYPFYLKQHLNPINRALHFFGLLLLIVLSCLFALRGDFLYIPLSLVPSYMLSWIGHYFFEKNKPATFNHPIYSVRGDVQMFLDILMRREKIFVKTK